MATIACFEIEDWMRPVFKKGLPKHKLLFFEGALSKEDLDEVKSADALVVFIYSQVTKEVLAKMPGLKLVTTMSTGFDHVAVADALKRKIVVCNVPFYGENTVAEHAMALILSISRHLPQSFDRAREGDFTTAGLRGFDLKGKTMGVVGGGHIGLHVVKYAKAFDMDVVVFDVFQNPAAQKELGFRYAPLNELLASSDVISLHAPYNPKTHHMLNSSNMPKIKKGAIIVNTARGGLMETSALLKALDDGTVSFAGLDVLESENLLKDPKKVVIDPASKADDLRLLAQDQVLLNHPRVFVTPHNAFNSQEALLRILDTTIENVDMFFAGKPQNQVKPLP